MFNYYNNSYYIKLLLSMQNFPNTLQQFFYRPPIVAPYLCNMPLHLCILFVCLCILFIVYVFLLLCVLRRSYPD